MPPTPIREIDPLFIPLADGTRLAAKMWIPEDADRAKVPAILEYIPYRRRDATAVRDSHTHPWMAARGYACVRVDLRGSGDSDGVLTDEYLPLELADGCEVIAWLARQDWCNGRVGMIGNSWGGFNGLQVAALRPPGLKAIITSCSTDDRYADDIHFMGGALLNDNLRWASTMFAHNSRPPDPTIVGERWRAMWRERLEGSGLWVETWLRHQRRDAFWRHGSVIEDHGAITAAVYAVGGWLDGYSNAIPRLMAGLRCPKKALIGPWGHRFPNMATPGPAVGFLAESLRWWDHWLKDIDTGLMAEPPIRVWMQEPVRPITFHTTMQGRWVREDQWPPSTIEARRLVLNEHRLEPGAAPERALTLCSPQTLGHTAGKWCPYGQYPDLPGDQREDDGGSLVFETPPLEAPVELLGAPVVELELAADRPQANLIARLSEVWPDGAATRISYGVLNLCHRAGHAEPAAIVPGERMRVRLQLNDLGQVVAAGHRIRLALSSAYWPILWPSPQTATLTVFTGASVLTLPVRPRDAEREDAGLGQSEAVTPLPTTTLEPGAVSYETTKSRADSGLVAVFRNDSGLVRYDAIGLDMRSRTVETFAIRPEEPLSAKATVAWEVEFARGDWRVSTATRSEMTATRDRFRVVATLDALENGKRVFTRGWDVAVPRDHV